MHYTYDEYVFDTAVVLPMGKTPPVPISDLESRGVYWLHLSEEDHVLVYLPNYDVLQVEHGPASYVTSGKVSYLFKITHTPTLKLVVAPGHAVLFPVEVLVDRLYPATHEQVTFIMHQLACPKKHEGQLHGFLRYMRNRLKKQG